MLAAAYLLTSLLRFPLPYPLLCPSWEDIGGYPSLKQRLQQVVEWPLRHAPAFTRLGLAPPKGVLLHGPPGCAKTLLARAAATASRATFLALSCAQVGQGWGRRGGEGTSRCTVAGVCGQWRGEAGGGWPLALPSTLCLHNICIPACTPSLNPHSMLASPT